MGANKQDFQEARLGLEAEKGMVQMSAVIFSCKAIHLNEEVVIGDGTTTKRLTPGMEIRIENNEMVNCSSRQPATHLLRECCTNIARTRARIVASDFMKGHLTTIDFTS